MSDYKISRRYATALFELGQEKGQLDRLESDSRRLFSAIESSKELQSVLSSPIIPSSQKEKAFLSIMKDCSPLLVNFLRLIFSKGREAYLPVITDQFLSMVDHLKDVVRAQVTTAGPMDAELKDKLASIIKKKTGKSVVLTEYQEPSIKSGLILQIGDSVFDASLTNKLDRLRTLLSN